MAPTKRTQRQLLQHLGINRDEIKDALKLALKEWLDERFAELGKWSARGIAVAALGLLTYLVLLISGWHPK